MSGTPPEATEPTAGHDRLGNPDRPRPPRAQIDPEAIERIRQAFAPIAEQLAAFMAALSHAMRPLAELAASPEGQAIIAAAEARRADPEQECHCLCIKNHPGTHQRCLWYVPASEIVTRDFGIIDVPMCRPCADATPAPPLAADC